MIFYEGDRYCGTRQNSKTINLNSDNILIPRASQKNEDWRGCPNFKNKISILSLLGIKQPLNLHDLKNGWGYKKCFLIKHPHRSSYIPHPSYFHVFLLINNFLNCNHYNLSQNCDSDTKKGCTKVSHFLTNLYLNISKVSH